MPDTSKLEKLNRELEKSEKKLRKAINDEKALQHQLKQLNLLLALIFYGTEGLDCSILFAPSDYAEGFIPFNITCGTLLKYQILLAFTCTLSVTGITLLISAISKNQIVAFVASMAIFLFPVLLPITEANPLFRLIGLLPLHHVQAVSLLSVEQMSNGMLYAVWAIPTALLFLGIGAVISRRVFAKHQVS